MGGPTILVIAGLRGVLGFTTFSAETRKASGKRRERVALSLASPLAVLPPPPAQTESQASAEQHRPSASRLTCQTTSMQKEEGRGGTCRRP